MPRESVAPILYLGLGFGLLGAVVSLILWTSNERTPAAIIARLWLTAEIAVRLHVHPYVAAAAACAVIGLVAARVFLAIARARGA